MSEGIVTERRVEMADGRIILVNFSRWRKAAGCRCCAM